MFSITESDHIKRSTVAFNVAQTCYRLAMNRIQTMTTFRPIATTRPKMK